MNQSKFDLVNTVFVSDLDGTLLNKSAVLSDFTVKTLNDCIQSGLKFTIATARTIESVRYIMKDIPLSLPMILMNGVLLFDPLTQKCTQIFFVSKDDYLFCVDKIRETDAGAFAYTIENNSSLMTHYETLKTPYMQEFFDERQQKYHKPFNQVENIENLSDGSWGETIYLTLLDVREKLDPVYEAVKTRAGLETAYYADIYSDGLWYLEIFSSRATKKNAAIELRRQTNASTMVGFGDNFNDLPMFEACDVKVAVANAKADVINAADIVIASNNDDGVAKFLLNVM